MMRCRVCGESELTPLWIAHGDDSERGHWVRCLACGSDSSSTAAMDVVGDYDAEYATQHIRILGSLDAAVVELRENVEAFRRHRITAHGRDFLDVGCLEGSALIAMARDGWSVHGFDVIAAAKDLSPPGDHITIAPQFAASLFPRRFAAVLCREVIEHVADWRGMLGELYAATLPGGMMQIQTPRPASWPDRIPYQRLHLQLHSPFAMRHWLERIGFDILESKLWPSGQMWLARRPT